MSDSILTSTKKLLGLDADDPSFDLDVVLHINSALSSLSQFGVGPAAGFMIEDAAATWEQLLGTDKNLNSAKTYVYLKVRLVFDPPTNPAVINALQEQIRENEWRLNVHRETTEWVDVRVVEVPDDPFANPIVIDGGTG